MEVDDTIKDKPDLLNLNNTSSASSQDDPSEGFERSQASQDPSIPMMKEQLEAGGAGGFMRETDVQQEQEQEQKQQKATNSSIDVSDQSTSRQELLAPSTASTTSSSPTSNAKSKNSLNLTLSPVGNNQEQRDKQQTEGRFTRSSLHLPLSDPPPTPPTRLASSNVKRRSSRSPNTATATASSSSPFSASTALQNAVTSSMSSANVQIDSSPADAGAIASSSSMKRSLSSPGSPANVKVDVFGSSTTPKKRSRNSESTSTDEAQGSRSSSPPAPLGSDGSSEPEDEEVALGSSQASRGSSSSQYSSSPPPEIGEGENNATTDVDPTSSPTSLASNSSSASASSPTRQTPTPRRVKVYALHESNWIDLGTGSCTYHRSVSRRSRKKRLEDSSAEASGSSASSSSSVDKPPTLPPASQKRLSIVGRAARDASGEEKGTDTLGGEEGAEEEGLLEVIDVTDDMSQLEDDEEETAWIEVVKEGRWKSDNKPSKARQREGKKVEGESENAATDSSVENRQSGEKGSNGHDEDDEKDEKDDDDEYERIWTTRIEKPESSALGFEMDSFVPQVGAEEGEEVIGRYRRQQDTLIVWKSSASDTELALSFAATAGCLEIWNFLKAVHSRWESQLVHSSREDGEGEMEESQEVHLLATPVQHDPPSGLGLGLGRFSQLGLLQDPALGNLTDLEKTIKLIGRTALGREKLSTYIGRSGFIQKLIPVFTEAEDLESLPDLHILCVLMHDIRTSYSSLHTPPISDSPIIVNLNDHGLWELVLNDDIFLDVISILEYDPNFPTMKAAYRAHLSDPSLYVEVVPIPDEPTKQKIHQIYRLQYIKDVILPRALDDGAFQIINSFIYFNQVDIVQYLSANEDFWKEIFQGTFPEQLPNGTGTDDDRTKEAKSANGDGTHHADETADRQQDVIAFLQSYAQTVKQLQPNMRSQTFRSLSERGLLRVLEYALSNQRLHDVQHVRVAVVEIIMLLVDNDPNSIRGFVLKEHETAGKQGTLLLALIKAFHKEEELGIKAQLAESIRVLLLPPGEASATETASARMRPDDPNSDSFLQYFYENGVALLLEPLVKGVTAPAEGTFLELSLQQIALYTHLCELLCFFVTHHSFRSKFFILSSSATVKVAALLKARPKHIRLAALRFFRACIGRNDDFYNRYLVKNHVLPPILALTKDEAPNDNLLASACLELFEYLRLNTTSRVILNDLMTKHEDDVKVLSTGLPVFKGIIAKWEQLNEPPPVAAEGVSSEADTVADASQQHQDPLDGPVHRDDRALTAEEEDYFNTEDDDEDSQSTNGTSTPTLAPMKRMETDSKQEDAELDSTPRKRQRMSVSSPNVIVAALPEAEKVSEQSATIDPSENDTATDPAVELARLREKRKRALDEEDDEDFLVVKRNGVEKDAPKAKAGTGGAKTKNVSGKLKLFFGKKA